MKSKHVAGDRRVKMVVASPSSLLLLLLPHPTLLSPSVTAAAMGCWNLTPSPSSPTTKSLHSLLLCQACEFPSCAAITKLLFFASPTNIKRMVLIRKGYPVYLSASARSRIRRRRVNAAAAIPDGSDEGDESDELSTGSSTRSQLDLLEQLVSISLSNNGSEISEIDTKLTVREQLSRLVGDGVEEITLPLGKRLPASVKSLTISQKRNIKRQAYLNEVSGRNDFIFFATIGAFVILPPLVILFAAVMTGYIDLSP